MRKIKNYIALTTVLQLLAYTSVSAQLENGLRKIIITVSDSVVKTSVIDKPLKEKTDKSGDYYWYYAGNINHNQGGYSGKLIHGKYEVFDNQQRLITQGSFINGQKQGSWIRWWGNGTTKESCSFKNGKLKGMLIAYDRTGNLLTEMNFKNNLLNGISKYYSKDKVLIKRYKSGKLVSEDEHLNKTDKPKTRKRDNDKAIKPDKTPGKSAIQQKRFRIFKKSGSKEKKQPDTSKTDLKK